jgi:cytochrome b561
MTTAEAARAAELPHAHPSIDAASIALHWATVILVAALFAVALSLGQAEGGESARTLLTLHRSLGVGVWLITLLRLGWRLTRARVPPLPESVPPIQRLAARLNEAALYALLLIQPLTGLVQSLFRGKAFDLFFWGLPPLVARDKAIVHTFHAIHEWGAWTLAAVIGVHASAALLHGLVLRDGVFQTMLPGRARSRRARPAPRPSTEHSDLGFPDAWGRCVAPDDSSARE